MNAFLSIPMEFRLAIVFVLGLCLGEAVNWAIYSLAWNRRPISPWSRIDPSAPRRRLWDRLPFVGWLGLRRESPLHGTCFWVRPMLLELLLGIGLAWLYWWEIGQMGLLPKNIFQFPTTLLHIQFLAHVVLIVIMLAATMIDVDEMTIPDEITIPGTLMGLLLAAAFPLSLLPDMIQQKSGPMQIASPNNWPAWLDGRPFYASLAIGLACWWLWCIALLPRTWYRRHGRLRALQLFWARLIRERSTYRILRMALMGTLAIAIVWWRGGHGEPGQLGWQGLLTALVGMAAGGGLIWMVRIVGAASLQREAMGFGDVTLMAMIGAFLGWQSCFIIFFLAPLAGLVVGVLRLILFRDKEVPYGPFLCMAALFLIVRWDAIWMFTRQAFELGWFAPLVMLFCLLMMGGMLSGWRMIHSLFR
jgi:leader peptidase (prepilin peptidase) / N-methyltransferase